MGGPLHWELTERLWKVLVENSNEGIWSGSVSALFREWDARGSQTRVTRTLKNLGRLEVIRQGQGTGTTSTYKLNKVDVPLTLDEFEMVAESVSVARRHTREVETRFMDQRLLDLSNKIVELEIRLEELENRIGPE